MDRDGLGRGIPVRVLIRFVAPFLVAGGGLAALFAVGGSAPRVQAVAVPVFLLLALATAVLGITLPRAVARLRSLRHGILVVALAAMLATSAVIAVSAAAMLVEPEDSVILIVLVGVGAALGLVLEYSVARDISHDIRVLAAATRDIAAGDLSARSSLDRADELGAAGRALDTLAHRLGTLESERERDRAARQAFLAALGHDLRTPLAALRASVEALQDGVAIEPPRALAAMQRNVEAMSVLVDDLFLLARIEFGRYRFERVLADVSELADDAVEALGPTAARMSVRVRVETPGRLIAPVGPSEVSRVIRNLLDNAIRHSPPGSEVIVRLAREGAGTTVRVIDQGPGLPEGIQQRLRGEPGAEDPADAPRRDGTGLGLEIAMGLVLAHQGRMWVEPGAGSHIAILLPSRDA